MAYRLRHRCRRGRLAMLGLDALRRSTRSLRIGGRSLASTSPEEHHPIDPVAAAATILNDIVAFSVWDTLLNAHYCFADNAAEKIDQRAFIVVQVMSLARCLCHFPPLSPISTDRWLRRRRNTRGVRCFRLRSNCPAPDAGRYQGMIVVVMRRPQLCGSNWR